MTRAIPGNLGLYNKKLFKTTKMMTKANNFVIDLQVNQLLKYHNLTVMSKKIIKLLTNIINFTYTSHFSKIYKAWESTYRSNLPTIIIKLNFWPCHTIPKSLHWLP